MFRIVDQSSPTDLLFLTDSGTTDGTPFSTYSTPFQAIRCNENVTTISQSSGTFFKGSLELCLMDISNRLYSSVDAKDISMQVLSGSATVLGNAFASCVRGVCNFTNRIGLLAQPGTTQTLTFQASSPTIVTTFSNLTVSISACEPGTFMSNNLCQPCGLGSFSNVSNAISCTSCEIGYYSNNLTASSCTPCPPGTFQKSRGSSGCSNCENGKYQLLTGQSDCVQCPVNTFARDQEDRSYCTQCIPPAYSNSVGSTSCSYCASDKYVAPQKTNTTLFDCYTCPLNAICNGNVTARTGSYLYSDPKTGQYGTIECPPGYCESGLCASNRKDQSINPLCGECIEGFYEWNSKCVSCPDSNAWVIMYLIISSLFVFLYHKLSSRDGDRGAELAITLFFIQMIVLFVQPAKLSNFTFFGLFDFNFFFIPISTGANGSKNCYAPLNPMQKFTSRKWDLNLKFEI